MANEYRQSPCSLSIHVCRGCYVHTECLLFHQTILEASADDLDPKSLVLDNPDLIDAVIPDALAKHCRHCGKPGATAAVVSTTERGKIFFYLHLLCARERGNRIEYESVHPYTRRVVACEEDEHEDANDEEEGQDAAGEGAQSANGDTVMAEHDVDADNVNRDGQNTSEEAPLASEDDAGSDSDSGDGKVSDGRSTSPGRTFGGEHDSEDDKACETCRKSSPNQLLQCSACNRCWHESCPDTHRYILPGAGRCKECIQLFPAGSTSPSGLGKRRRDESKEGDEPMQGAGEAHGVDISPQQQTREDRRLAEVFEIVKKAMTKWGKNHRLHDLEGREVPVHAGVERLFSFLKKIGFAKRKILRDPTKTSRAMILEDFPNEEDGFKVEPEFLHKLEQIAKKFYANDRIARQDGDECQDADADDQKMQEVTAFAGGASGKAPRKVPLSDTYTFQVDPLPVTAETDLPPRQNQQNLSGMIGGVKIHLINLHRVIEHLQDELRANKNKWKYTDKRSLFRQSSKILIGNGKDYNAKRQRHNAEQLEKYYQAAWPALYKVLGLPSQVSGSGSGRGAAAARSSSTSTLGKGKKTQVPSKGLPRTTAPGIPRKSADAGSNRGAVTAATGVGAGSAGRLGLAVKAVAPYKALAPAKIKTEKLSRDDCASVSPSPRTVSPRDTSTSRDRGMGAGTRNSPRPRDSPRPALGPDAGRNVGRTDHGRKASAGGLSPVTAAPPGSANRHEALDGASSRPGHGMAPPQDPRWQRAGGVGVGEAGAGAGWPREGAQDRALGSPSVSGMGNLEQGSGKIVALRPGEVRGSAHASPAVAQGNGFDAPGAVVAQKDIRGGVTATFPPVDPRDARIGASSLAGTAGAECMRGDGMGVRHEGEVHSGPRGGVVEGGGRERGLVTACN